MNATSGALWDAYERLHAFGPEYGGDEEGNHGMTNHGPMAVEVMVRRGLDVNIDRWLDAYVRRLAEQPRASDRIPRNGWRAALGDASRLPDWTAFFRSELRERPWRHVLIEWWPRLLPGIVAGSTHGVIRVGHAVRALSDSICEPPQRETLDELAHGLGFWAARYRELSGVASPGGRLTVAHALTGIARLPGQSGLIAHRLDRLERSAQWSADLRTLRPATRPEEAMAALESLVDAAVGAYLGWGHGAPVLLVHTATAPNAVRHVLPVLPTDQWLPSLTAAWAASAAIVATYAPIAPAPDAEGADQHRQLTPSSALERAAAHGDEHVLKFTDTALEAYDRTGDPRLLAATAYAGTPIGSA